MNFFNNITMSLLSKNLDGLWLRQQTTMENIANKSTPNYKSKYVDFEHELEQKFNEINDKKICKVSEIRKRVDSSNIILGTNNNKTSRLDGNNVDIEKENVDLLKTQYNYEYSVFELKSYFSKMKSAITSLK